MSAPLRLGIAGLGRAAHMLLPAVARSRGVVLTAVADPSDEAREAFLPGPLADRSDGIEALCTRPDVDLVYIATPTHLHVEHALLALARGKHVILEKPMATTLEDATRLVDAAEQAGRCLIVGHSQSFEPPIRAMRELVRGDSLGPLCMLNTWYYTDWLYRPRRPEELDTSLGGGVVFRQGAHQADLVRWIGGGMVSSVRASVTAWDRERPAEGSHVLFLEFEDGAAATAVFSGYGHFDSSELTFGLGEQGQRADPRAYGRARAALRGATASVEETLKRAGAAGAGGTGRAGQPMYGLTVVTCEGGDIRQTPRGLRVYGDERREEVRVPVRPTGRDLLLAEAYDAIVHGRAPAHEGRWGRANLEVCLAALESARTRREVSLHHQVPTPDGGTPP